MKPSDAYECLTHGRVDRVPIDELVGRITTMLVTPYPPGIPLLIPGERFNHAIVEYLKFARSFNAQFPGLSHRRARAGARGGQGSRSYFVDCVRLGDKVLARRLEAAAESRGRQPRGGQRTAAIVVADRGSAAVGPDAVPAAYPRPGRTRSGGGDRWPPRGRAAARAGRTRASAARRRPAAPRTAPRRLHSATPRGARSPVDRRHRRRA